jgi:hypothetical protein
MSTIPYVIGGLGLVLGTVRWVTDRRAQVAHDAGKEDR